VAVAGEGVGAAGGFDEDFRPDEAGLDVNRGDFADANADFVLAEEGTFAAGDGFIADFDDGGEKKVATGPTTGLKGFGWHADGSLSWGFDRKQQLCRESRACLKVGCIRSAASSPRPSPPEEERGMTRTHRRAHL
jgi:hypothetical protein